MTESSSSASSGAGAGVESELFDFGGAHFDLDAPRDREIVRFILSQALYGEATGVYCGKSLFAAQSLEAAHFYVRQAKQELGHLKLFADILKALDMVPEPGHWALRLLSSHNNYYPLKVLMEHAIGEGLVLDVFRDVLLQTLPNTDPRVGPIKKKLEVICREEAEHVAWGEKEAKRLLQEKPWLRPAYFGLVEFQLTLLPLLAKRFQAGFEDHPVLRQLPEFLEHTRKRVYAQGRRLGYVPEEAPGPVERWGSIGFGFLLYLRSQLARARSTLEKTYLTELGFDATR